MGLPMVWYAVIDRDQPLSDLFSFNPHVTVDPQATEELTRDKVKVKITIEECK